MDLKEDCHYLHCQFHISQHALIHCMDVSWLHGMPLPKVTSFIAAMAAQGASMAWHPTEDNTVASLI